MNKKNLLEKKFIVEILSLILIGENTNIKLSQKTKKTTATISEQIDYLKNNGLIFLKNDKKVRYNEKEYMVSLTKPIELFFIYYLKKKEYLQFKNNDCMGLVFSFIISSKKDSKELKQLTLLDIFSEAYKFFIYRAIEFKRAGISPLEGFTIKDKKIEVEFKDFLTMFYNNFEKEKLKFHV